MLVRANSKNNRTIKIPSKKAMAAKLRRKALKAPKHIYDKEKMPLMDAVAVLRVSTQPICVCCRLFHC